MTEAVKSSNTSRKWLVTVALAAGVGLGAYGIAGAATSSTTTKPPSSGSTPTFHSNEDPAHEKAESPEREAQENSGQFRFHGPGRPGCDDHEKLVTGTTSAKIKAAALKAYPGATITKTEQRSDGTYEAELTTKTGTELHVSLDKNFKVLADHHGGPDGHWGRHFGGGYAPGDPQGNAPSA